MVAIPESFDGRLREVEFSSRSNEDKLNAHEDLCAERYKNIHESIGDINRTVRWAAASLLTGMAAILVKLLFFAGP